MQGFAAENILVVSYTTDAAAEFKSRLSAAAGPAAGGVPVMTFHALALSLIKEFRCVHMHGQQVLGAALPEP